MNRKIFAFAFIIILIANLILFAAGLIGNLLFWVTIIAIALVTYFGFTQKK